MVVVVPTALEREIAAAAYNACATAWNARVKAALDRAERNLPACLPDDRNRRADEESIVASALAHHRERCTSLATAIVAGVVTDARFTVDELDEWLAVDGALPWYRKPERFRNVSPRDLVEAHRNLLRSVESARELIPRALRGA